MADTRFMLSRVIPLFGVIIVIAGLYLGREFLLPIAIAVLISFLLAPVVRRLEKWGLGHIFSVIIVTILTFALIGAVIYVIAGQLIDLANKLPEYQDNLRGKVTSLRVKDNSTVNKLTKTLREITEEAAEPESPTVENAEPGPPPVPVEVVDRAEKAEPGPPPVRVEVVDRADTAFGLVRDVVTPLLAPLGMAAIVIVFVIFMLIERQSLRDRFIHLIGHGRLQLTTQALDDAGSRVSRYLGAQFIVNASYAVPIGLGLMAIGIPNAVLWGFLAFVLRFIPYIGPWIAASFPLMLSLAVTPTWLPPVLVLTLFVVVELISNNVVEPWLYGASTGLSPIAVITSAVFWTWLWGAGGLLLATPLTVCVAVLGKYIPSLTFLDVLLGDNPPIAAQDRFYQRLLAGDELEVTEIAETYVEKGSPVMLFDEVIMPMLRQAEKDARRDTLDETDRREVYRLTRELILSLDIPKRDAVLGEEARESKIFIFPAQNEADELAGLMLCRLLDGQGIQSEVESAKTLTSEMIQHAVAEAPAVICISAVACNSQLPAANLCSRLKAQIPGTRVNIGFWGGDLERGHVERLRRVQPNEIFPTLAAAVPALVVQMGLESGVEEERELDEVAEQARSALS